MPNMGSNALCFTLLCEQEVCDAESVEARGDACLGVGGARPALYPMNTEIASLRNHMILI